MLRLGGSFSFLQQEFTIRFGSRSERSTFAYRCQHVFDGSKASSSKPHQIGFASRCFIFLRRFNNKRGRVVQSFPAVMAISVIKTKIQFSEKK
ncbi:unnamed protein product [Arabidopsis lyrata]|nr:unnamed protein product [Arabidopsis lyrata]